MDGRVGMPQVLVLLLGLAPCGCPADATGGTNETGGVIEAEPIDPFDGQGNDPPGHPDPGLIHRPPTSLGNGLVHDSRFDLGAGEFSRIVSNAELSNGVDWGGFVDSHAQKLRVGFRPVQVDAEVGVESDGTGGWRLTVQDRSVYVSDDDANYRTAAKTYVFSNLATEQALASSGPSEWGKPRPTAIDTFAIAPNVFGVSIVWTYDNAPHDWELITGQSEADFAATVAALKLKGYRPISVSSRTRNGAGEYAGIFVQDGAPPDVWQEMLALDGLALGQQGQQAWADGYCPYAGSYRQGSELLPRFDVLWMVCAPGQRVELRYNLDETLFAEQDQAWRQQGYALASASAYMDAGVERFAGLWVKYEPYLRWTEGVAIDLASPVYQTQLKPFHDQAIATMTLEGEMSEGEYFRPSSTLHVYFGGQLVLDRAYTFAPAIYPDTPIDAPMLLASASKSITAAAVVKELAEEGVPLTAAFGPLMGLNLPASMISGQPPSVADVLRGLGGFVPNVLSYEDHALIDQSIWGSYPISGKELLDYAVLDGHIDPMVVTKDTYWALMEFDNAVSAGKLAYSNPGYTFLGELLRFRTGKSYEDYVRTELLAPLNLEDKIYADPGHRNAHRVPTKASLRSYLINSRHPYRTVGCEIDAHCGYLACPDQDLNCSPPSCGPNGTCLGCDANQLCEAGWACMAGECINTTVPRLGSEPLPGVNKSDDGYRWLENTGPLDASAPATASRERYAGGYFVGGAPLAAGGWYADGQSLGILIRVLVQSAALMPQPVAAQLWNPIWWNQNHNKGSGWSYGLGWYVRGNWVAMAGGAGGAMVTVAHNRAYDVTVVHLANLKGNGISSFLNPLMDGNGVWDTSVVGQQWPCADDLSTFANECSGAAAAY